MCIWHYETTTDDLPLNVSFVPPDPPGYAVTAVQGCDDTYPSTGNCPQSGFRALFIYGRELSEAVNVSFDFGTYLVTCRNHIYTSASLIVCTEYTGNGTDGTVMLHSPASTEFVFYDNPNITVSFQNTSTIDCGANDACNNNGRCDPIEGCQCLSNALNGFWNGSYCDRCQDLKYGPRCTLSCDGPCACVHGRCSDGVNGTGCVCIKDYFLGYWSGETCELCEGQYYGPSCTQVCPARINETAACGLGICSDGLYGTGQCSCPEGVLKDVNGSCSICDAGYFGPSCSYCGRPNATTPPCYGNGVCSDGITGTGLCRCSLGFIGDMCDTWCPVANNETNALAPCGNGTCVRTGVCECHGNWTTGPTGACTQCLPGYYGPRCEFFCPDCHRGRCNDGTTGDGTCICNFGAWGTYCDGVCPGPSNAPCYNHGTCSLMDGTCSCYSNSTHGYWRGLYCNQCQQSYLSDNCSLPCPVVNGQICNARGVCYNGECTKCLPKYPDTYHMMCGFNCNSTNEACVPPISCPVGFWGYPACTSRCPGASFNLSNACSAQGYCDALFGNCTCFFGRSGSSCEVACPLGRGTTGVIYPCAGNGQCALNGTCLCKYGYYGSSCANECPGGANNVCNGNGVCTAIGDCACSLGFYGPTCAGICPGGVSHPCNDQGVCNNLGQCECIANSTSGFYGGTACDQCRVGYAGETCLDPCNPTSASSINHKCVCNPGYAGSDCTIPCPGVVSGVVCNNRGVCFDGNRGNGTCQCDTDWYGSSCTVQCTPQLCFTTLGLVNAMCNATTGACQCLTGTSNFAGQKCDVCADGFWGVMCTLPCDCNNNGRCEQYSGTCECFADDTHGYWQGQRCATCRDGYMGDMCTQRNMQLSVGSPTTAAVKIDNPGVPGFLIHDESNSMYIGAGSEPVLFFNGSATTLSFFGSAQCNGTVLGVRVSPSVVGAIDVWTVNSSVLQRQRIFYSNLSQVITMPTLFDAPTAPLHVGNSVASRRHAFNSRHVQELAVSSLSWDGYASKTAFDSASGVYVVFNNGSVSIFSLTFGTFSTFNVTLSTVSWIQVDRSGTLVILSGSNPLGTWAAELFDVDSSGTILPLMTLDDSTHVVADCGGTSSTSCTSASVCALIVSTGELYCVLRKVNVGLVYASFTLNASAFVATSSLVVSKIGLNSINVTAIAEDTYFKCVFLAFNWINSGSTIIQINTTKPATIFSQVDPPSSSVVQVASSLYLDSIKRELIVVRQAAFSATISLINLFGVNKVTPNVLDSKGTTPVTIQGYGFAPLSPVQCSFGSGSLSNATILDNYTITCNATTEDLGGGQCLVVNFNLVSGMRSTQATNTPLSRVASATLLAASNSDGLVGYTAVDSPTVITLTGFGFVSSIWAQCRLVDRNGNIIVQLSPVTYLSGNSVSCGMPALTNATVPPTYVEYSHDGTVFGTSRALFAVVGDAYDIVAAFVDPSDATHTIPATSVTKLPPMHVFLVDRYGNRRGALETSSPLFRATTVSSSGGNELLTWSNASTNIVAMRNGVALFSSLMVDLPLMGTYTIYMRSVNSVEDSLDITIVPGTPYRVNMLNVSRMLSVWTVPVKSSSALTPSPTVIIVDVAGNQVTNVTELPVEVILMYVNARPNATTGAPDFNTAQLVAVPDAAGVYTYSGVDVRTVYDSNFVMTFQASIELGNGPIGSYTTPVIPSQNCVPGSEYAVTHSFTCLPCPAHAICDGTSSVSAQSGYWRSTVQSYVFYSCHPPEGNDACTLSVAGCLDGYTGPRCSSCVDGYGKSGDSCVQCAASSVNWGLSWLIFFVIVGLCSVLVVRSLADASSGAKADTTVVVVKSLVSHAQVLGALSSLLQVSDMPSFFATFFQTGGQAYIQVNLSFFSCAITHTALDSFIFSVSVPWVLFAFVCIVVFCRGGLLFYLGYRVERMRLNYQEKRHMQRAKKSMFNKNSESFNLLASMGGNLPYELDNQAEDVDPHELAIYRMDAFGDEMPSSDDEDDVPEDSVHPSVKDVLAAPKPLATHHDDVITETPQFPATGGAMSSLGTSKKRGSVARLRHSVAIPADVESPRRQDSRRSVRIVDTPEYGNTRFPTPTPTKFLPSESAGPAPSTVANPLDPSSNPLLGRPTRSDDGGSAEVAFEATDPSGFGPSVEATAVTTPDDSMIENRRRNSARSFSIRQTAQVSTPAGQDPFSGNSEKVTRRLKSFQDAARKAIIIKKDKKESKFSRMLSQRGKMLKDVVDMVRSSKSLDRSLTSISSSNNGENALTQQYIPTFGFPLASLEPQQQLSVRKQMAHTAAVTFLVIMFLMYPTVIKACLSMFPCETIDYGTYHTSVLIAERTVNCNSRSFLSYRNGAGALLLLYGLGVPAFTIGLVYLLRYTTLDGDMELAKMVFFFVTGGFRGKMWFWESVTMLRKASILIIIAMISDLSEKRYVASVAMSIFFILNRYARPYQQDILHVVESVSLLDIAITTNLFMLFPYFPYSANPSMYWLILILVFVVNMLTLLVFAYGLFTSTANLLFKTSIFQRITQPSPKELMKRHEQVVKGLETTRRMCLAVHPRAYDMDEFLYEAYSLAVVANAKLEKMGQEVTSHMRRMKRRAKKEGQDATVVANLVSAMLVPTTSAFEGKLRDILAEATSAIVYVGAMRAFVSTQVQQAISSQDDAFKGKIDGSLDELYRAEINVLKTSKRLRRALRRLGGSAGEFRNELSSDEEGSDDKFLFEDEEAEEEGDGAATKQSQTQEQLFRDYDAERRALNAALQDLPGSLIESDEASRDDAASTMLDEDDYFSMIEQRQSAIARRLVSHATEGYEFPTTSSTPYQHVDEPVFASSAPSVASQPRADFSALGAGVPMLHTPDADDGAEELDYIAMLASGRAVERRGSKYGR